MIIRDIVEDHADEVAGLWMLRNVALEAPHYSLDDLSELDTRLETHLRGLRLGGETAWEICVTALATGEAAEVFAAAIVALRAGNPGWIGEVLSAVKAAPASRRGLVSALGWLDKAEARTVLKAFLTADSALQEYAGVAGCAVRRINPGKALNKAITADDPILRTRALRAAGELGRIDLLESLREQLTAQAPDSRYRAAWSAVLLGERKDSVPVLREFTGPESALRLPALQLLVRVLPPGEVRKLLNEVARSSGGLHEVVIAAGASGDAAYAPWLLKHMNDPLLARAAAESFTLITGLDLVAESMEIEPPQEPEADDEADEQGGDIDRDEDLPWPDVDRIANWWSANQSRFSSGQRYLLGQSVQLDACQRVLRHGLQRQRQAAALEMALGHPQAALVEVRAPGFRQVAG